MKNQECFELKNEDIYILKSLGGLDDTHIEKIKSLLPNLVCQTFDRDLKMDTEISHLGGLRIVGRETFLIGIVLAVESPNKFVRVRNPNNKRNIEMKIVL